MFTLFTDSDGDFTLEEAKKYGMKMISMPYIVGDKIIKPYEDFKTFDSKAFYDMLRKGTIPTTCGISAEEYMQYFEPEFKAGNDILYVHFSAAMTCTFSAMKEALEMLKEKYPERHFYQIDTKGITICSYTITKEIAELYQAGKSVEEILAWAEKEVDHFATYFFADDLKFFHRSGRVSGISAFFGGIIGVRPILTMDGNGIMKSVGTVKGRKSAINELVKYVETLGDDLEHHRIIIGNSDNLELAHKVGDALKEKYGDKVELEYVTVNPTAGSHCGPDGVGVCFHAVHR